MSNTPSDEDIVALARSEGIKVRTGAGVVKLVRAVLEKWGAAQPVVREPLTDREIELLDGMIDAQLNHAQRCDSIPNHRMAERQKSWDIERASLLQKLKAEHCITQKGGQHGTER